jgi:mono/diheme cytochrome c family protein
MRPLFLALLFASLPAAAQDAERGKLVYETQCGGCHYKRVHERARADSIVKSMSDLRDQVVLRAGQTGRPFTLEDLEDVTEYLDRSYYKFSR